MNQKTDAENAPIQDATAAFELALNETGQGSYVLSILEKIT